MFFITISVTLAIAAFALAIVFAIGVTPLGKKFWREVTTRFQSIFHWLEHIKTKTKTKTRTRFKNNLIELRKMTPFAIDLKINFGMTSEKYHQMKMENLRKDLDKIWWSSVLTEVHEYDEMFKECKN